jgi:hypothetical protein
MTTARVATSCSSIIGEQVCRADDLGLSFTPRLTVEMSLWNEAYLICQQTATRRANLVRIHGSRQEQRTMESMY